MAVWRGALEREKKRLQEYATGTLQVHAPLGQLASSSSGQVQHSVADLMEKHKIVQPLGTTSFMSYLPASHGFHGAKLKTTTSKTYWKLKDFAYWLLGKYRKSKLPHRRSLSSHSRSPSEKYWRLYWTYMYGGNVEDAPVIRCAARRVGSRYREAAGDPAECALPVDFECETSLMMAIVLWGIDESRRADESRRLASLWLQ
eukprot:7306115-Karenia_brevis.AAC.1